MGMHKGLLGQSEGGGSVGDKTLEDYIRRKQRAEAFDAVANEKYFTTVNSPQFREANLLVFKAERSLIGMGMSKIEAREWIKLWASGAGDGIE